MYLCLEDVAVAWASESGVAFEDALQQVLKAFWLGEFDRLGADGGPGTVLGADYFVSFVHPDRTWIGNPISRRQLLHDILGPVTGLPEWGIWRANGSDPRGVNWQKLRIEGGHDDLDDRVFLNLSICPIDAYPKDAQEFLRNLAFPPDVLERWFQRRGQRIPEFVKQATTDAPPVELGTEVASLSEDGEFSSRVRARFSQSGLREWYEKRVADYENKGLPPPSREEDWEAAKREVHSNIPRDPVRALRRALAPPHWKAFGRRRQKSQPESGEN